MKIFLVLAILKCASAASMCKDEDSTTNQPDTCPHPTVITKDIDIPWFLGNNEKTGWIQGLGNKVARFHIAEILKGDVLAEDFDDYADMCVKSKYSSYTAEYNNGTFSGFGGKTGKWECNGISAEPGAYDCIFSSDLTKYKESLKFYPTYTDNKNFYVIEACFPNGQVGWMTHSINPLSAEERQALAKHIKEIGFDEEIVEMFGDACPK